MKRNVAQLGSASALGAEGRRFESCHSENVLSSVVERWFPKPNVVGSTPTGRVITRDTGKGGTEDRERAPKPGVSGLCLPRRFLLIFLC